MDFTESTKIVYSRIQKLEPENVSKIIGYLLLQDHGDRDMIRLAFGPDTSIHSLINKAKSELNLTKPAVTSTPVSLSLTQVNSASVAVQQVHYVPYSPASSPSLSSSPPSIRASSPYQFTVDHQQGHNLEFIQPGCLDPTAEDYLLQKQMQFLSLEEQVEPSNSAISDFWSNHFYSEPLPSVRRTSRMSPSLPELPLKICHYFSKGFCKHGNNCRYFHGHPMPESFSQTFNSNSNEVSNDDYMFSPGSLEKLELELTDLLKSRRGLPVSIASLPMLYYEKYGRVLQAEGYLTESQRHGKAGYSLTKLLARLKNSICLIDR